MKHRAMVSGLTVLAATIWLGVSVPVSAEEFVYGRQLMTEQEMVEHREQMRSLKTEQAREAYRLEHHKRMQLRAEERGLTLPDEPGPYGRGAGPRDGSGIGIGAQGGGRRGIAP